MSVPLYVPVLPTRPHATAAYRELTPDVQRRVVPLWTLPPRPGMLPKPLAERIGKDADDVTAAQRHGSAWLDAPFADATEAAVLAEALTLDWWDHRNLWPVTGPGRPVAQQSLALAVARRREDVLGIRVRLPGEWNEGTASDVRALLDRLPANHPAALFLDLCTVLPDRPEAAKEALRALDSLIPLTSWHTVTVVAGGFPNRRPTSGKASRTRPRAWTGKPGTRSSTANARTSPDSATATTESTPPRTSPRPRPRAAEARRGASSATPPPAPTTCPRCRTAGSTTTPTGRPRAVSPGLRTSGARRRVPRRGGCATEPGARPVRAITPRGTVWGMFST